MRLLSLKQRFLGSILLLHLFQCQAVSAEEIWSPFSLKRSLKIKESSQTSKPQDLTRNSIGLEKNKEKPSKDSTLVWEVLPSSPSKNGMPLIWEPIPKREEILSTGPTNKHTKKKHRPVPSSYEEAQSLLRLKSQPEPEDYLPPLRLGAAVPTANQVSDLEFARISAFQISPFDGGEAGGTGNQNYAARVDFNAGHRLQLSGFISEADDPLYSKIVGRSTQPGNFWRSYGGAIQWKLISNQQSQGKKRLNQGLEVAFTGSIEGWEVGSGGCDSKDCKGKDEASPNIFNNSGKRVFTNNLVGSLAFPITWTISQKWQATISPGASFLPGSQGKNQGGAGSFYGNNFWIASGVLWRPISELGLFSSVLVPFGPGNNSFDSSLNFSNVPIYSGGITWNLNPRISLEGALTNGWGASPATSLLTLPSTNRIGYSARFVYTYDAPDSPQVELSRRQKSLASGGLTVNTALVPPDQTTQAWANIDSEGNLFGFIGSSISNIFQLQLTNVGWFNNVPQTNDLARTFTTDKGYNWRIGGKAVSFSPLRGAPLWVAGRISLGRNKDPDSYQGYVFAESIQTWEANDWLAFNFNTKGAWSGISNPWGIGLGANLQLSKKFQLIPEGNIVISDKTQSNATLSLRWLINNSMNMDIYMSNASGLQDIGQLLKSLDTRFGGRLSIMF